MFVLKSLHRFFFGTTEKNSLRYKLSKYFFSWSLLLLSLGLIIYFILHFFVFRYSLLVTINEMIYITVIFLFVIIFSNYILTLFVTKYILKPFEDIASQLDDVKGNNYSKSIDYKDKDEIGTLVIFINNLLKRVDRAIQNERKHSLIDPLTNIYNRRALIINFESLKSNAQRQEYDLALALIDLDDFKKVNDIYGHDKGDQVLKKFVKLVKKEIRVEDFFCRFGGEEFLLLLINIGPRRTKNILERIRSSVKANLKSEVPKIDFDITISGGYVHSSKYDLYESTVLNNMIVDADKNLYKAKRSGKDKIF